MKKCSNIDIKFFMLFYECSFSQKFQLQIVILIFQQIIILFLARKEKIFKENIFFLYFSI